MRSFLLALFIMSQSVLATDKISDSQWKYRLLIIPQSTEDLQNQIDEEEAGLDERDLKVFILSGPGASEYPAGEKLAAEFTNRLSPNPDEPKIYLIGKDGRTTLSWKTGEFSFEKLFASIDAMPMRQREMRKGQ